MTRRNTTRTGLLAAALAAALLVSAHPADAQETPWFHLRVEEPGGERVSLNLPLGLVEVGLEIAEREMTGEEFRWGPRREGNISDLRRLWGEIREAGDAEIAEIQDGDTHVRISQAAGRVLVRVDEGDGQTVRLEMPSAVADVLLGTEGERLDLRGAVQELARSGQRDVLDIRDGETTVRVWIGDRGDPGDES